MAFVDEFEKRCKSAGKSPTAVCMEIGLSNATYTYWNKYGATPRKNVVQKVADYFGCTVEDLTGTASYSEEVQPVAPKADLSLSKQETEMISIYRNLSLKQQAELVNFLISLTTEQE